MPASHLCMTHTMWSHISDKKNHKTDQTGLSCCLHARNEQANLLTACTQGSRRQDRFDLFCDSLITNVTPHGTSSRTFKLCFSEKYGIHIFLRSSWMKL